MDRLAFRVVFSNATHHRVRRIRAASLAAGYPAEETPHEEQTHDYEGFCSHDERIDAAEEYTLMVVLEKCSRVNSWVGERVRGLDGRPRTFAKPVGGISNPTITPRRRPCQVLQT